MADSVIASLKVEVGVDNAQAHSGLQQTKGDIKDVAKEATAGQAPAQGFFSKVLGGGLELAKAVPGIGMMGGAIADVATNIVKGNAAFETYETQFSVLLKGSGSMADGMARAKDRIKELSTFAATTPFELPQVVQAGKVLQAFGLQGEQSMKRFGLSTTDMLTVVGDAAAGSGADFTELANTFGKFASGATGDALSRLQELGIATKAQLTEVGVQFNSAGALVTPVDEAFSKMVKLVKGHMGGMMEAQSQTFDGMMSNLSDWIGQTQRTLMAPIFDVLKTQLGNLLTFLGSDEVKNTIGNVATLLANGIGGAMSTIGSIISTVGPPIMQFLGSVLANGFNIVSQAVNAVMPIITDFATFLGKAFAGENGRLPLLEKLPGFLQPLGRIIGDIVQNIGEFINALSSGQNPIQAIGNLIKNNLVDVVKDLTGLDLSGFIDGLINFGSQAADAIGKFAQQAIHFFSDVMDFIGSPGVQGVLNNVKGFIIDGLVNGWQAVSAAWNTSAPIIANWIQQIWQALQPLISAAGTVFAVFGQGGFAGVFDLISGKIATTNPLLQTLQNIFAAIQPILQAAVNIWNNLSVVFGNIAAQVMPSLTAAWNNLQPGLAAIGPVLQGAIPVIQTIGEIVGAIIGGVVIATFSAVVGIIQGVIDALPGLGQAFSGVFEIISGIINGFWTLISGIWQLLSDLFTGNFDAIGQDFVNIWNGLVSSVGQIVQGLYDTVSGIINGLIGFLTGLFQGFWDTLVGIWQGISDALIGHSIITDMVSQIQGAIQGLVDTVVGFFTGLWNTIVKTATDFVVNVMVQVISFRDQAVAKVTELKDTALSLVSTLWNNIVSAAKDFVVNVMVHVLAFKDQAITTVTNLKDTALSTVQNIWDSIVKGATDFVVSVMVQVISFKDQAIAGFNTLKDLALGAITGKDGLISGIIGAFAGLLQNGTDAAGNIIQGMLNGLSAGKDQVVNFIEGIASSSLDAIKNFFGIHSPSTKMQEIAANALAGFNIGLGEGKDDTTNALTGIGNTVAGWADNLSKTLQPSYDALSSGIGAAISSMGDIVSQNIDPENAEGLFGKWHLLLGKMGTQIDQGKTSLKAYAGEAFRSVFENIKVIFAEFAPQMQDEWTQALNGMKAATDTIVDQIKATLAGLNGTFTITTSYNGGAVAGGTGGGGTGGGGQSSGGPKPGGVSGGGAGGGGAGQISGMLALAGPGPGSTGPGMPGIGSVGTLIMINGLSVTDAPQPVAEWLREVYRRKNNNNLGPNVAGNPVRG